MALTYTPPGELDFPLPEFQLNSVEEKPYASELLAKDKILVVLFICNHCPYVKAIEDRILNLAKSFAENPIQFVGICSNDPTDYPEDSPEQLLKRWNEKNYEFPYLIDSDQHVAKAFGAVCTPDIFVFGRDRKLKYRGRLDDAWKNPNQVRKQELRDAIEAILQGEEPSTQNPSMGCSIKWK
jgi:thiol-disulfide isomerase/thioredoxin